MACVAVQSVCWYSHALIVAKFCRYFRYSGLIAGALINPSIFFSLIILHD